MDFTKINKRAAKAVMGVCIAALLAGQWALVSGPVSQLGRSGLDAAAHSDGAGVAMYGGLHLLLLAGLPLVNGLIGLCLLVVYNAWSKAVAERADIIDVEPVKLPRQGRQEGRA